MRTRLETTSDNWTGASPYSRLLFCLKTGLNLFGWKMNWLFVDMDETLLKTDLLWEQSLQLIKSKPFIIFKFPWWILKGSLYFKNKIAQEIPHIQHNLIYNEDVLKKVDEFRLGGAKTILASASPSIWVNEIARRTGLFDGVMASDLEINLKAENKLNAIEARCQGQAFTYIGDSTADLVIWQKSAKVIAVNPSKYLHKKLRQLNKPLEIIKSRSASLRPWIKLLRIHQVVKNLLVFLPFIAAHQTLQLQNWINASFAFVGFSLCAFLVYTLNDALDMGSDRQHPSKRHRPLASGELGLKQGFYIFSSIVGLLLLLSIFLLRQSGEWASFFIFMLSYLILNILYSFRLKHILILDVVVLSIMYTLRLYAGAAACHVLVSEWLLSFSTFFFLSLACLKRCTEILRMMDVSGPVRAYRKEDFTVMLCGGIGVGILSVLIVMLYIQSEIVRQLYTHPQVIWLVSPVLMYWILRIWVLCARSKVNDDPVVFAIKDKISWICLMALILIFAGAL